MIVLPSDDAFVHKVDHKDDTVDHKDDRIEHKDTIEMVVTNEIQTCHKNFSPRSPPPVFQWPEQASTLHHIQTREAEAGSEPHGHGLSPEMMDKLKQLGIYRENGQTDVNSNLKDLARETGLGMRRKSIRISFDTFMSKSRPGLVISDGEESKEDKENFQRRVSITNRMKEKHFGNVRRRNNSWTEKQKINKKAALRSKSLTLNS